jgi:hypothetical protein
VHHSVHKIWKYCGKFEISLEIWGKFYWVICHTGVNFALPPGCRFSGMSSFFLWGRKFGKAWYWGKVSGCFSKEMKGVPLQSHQ